MRATVRRKLLKQILQRRGLMCMGARAAGLLNEKMWNESNEGWHECC